jgi:hypothetical protein
MRLYLLACTPSAMEHARIFFKFSFSIVIDADEQKRSITFSLHGLFRGTKLYLGPSKQSKANIRGSREMQCQVFPIFSFVPIGTTSGVKS